MGWPGGRGRARGVCAGRRPHAEPWRPFPGPGNGGQAGCGVRCPRGWGYLPDIGPTPGPAGGGVGPVETWAVGVNLVVAVDGRKPGCGCRWVGWVSWSGWPLGVGIGTRAGLRKRVGWSGLLGGSGVGRWGRLSGRCRRRVAYCRRPAGCCRHSAAYCHRRVGFRHRLGWCRRLAWCPRWVGWCFRGRTAGCCRRSGRIYRGRGCRRPGSDRRGRGCAGPCPTGRASPGRRPPAVPVSAARPGPGGRGTTPGRGRRAHRHRATTVTDAGGA